MHGPIHLDPTFYVGIGLVLFILVIVWRRVPHMLGAQLDARAAKIAGELDEAKRLRTEAEALLAAYQAKTGEAEREAAAILAGAKEEAERLQAEGRQALEQLIARRTALAETKIKQAEAEALAEVKAASADAAIAAARTILTNRIDGVKAGQLADASIRDLRARLN